MQPITVDVQISLQEYHKLNYTLLLRNRWAWINFALGVLLIGFAILEYLKPLKAHTGVFIYNPAVMIFVGFWCILYYPVFIFFSGRKHYLSSKGLQALVRYTLTETQIIEQIGIGGANFGWLGLYKVAEVGDFILLYNSIHSYNILPKRVFTAEQFIELRDFLKCIPGLKVKLRNIFRSEPITKVGLKAEELYDYVNRFIKDKRTYKEIKQFLMDDGMDEATAKGVIAHVLILQKKKAKEQMKIGATIAIAGIGISVLSYILAPYNHYQIIITGPTIAGIVIFFIGFSKSR